MSFHTCHIKWMKCIYSSVQKLVVAEGIGCPLAFLLLLCLPFFAALIVNIICRQLKATAGTAVVLLEPGLEALLRMKDVIVMARHDNNLLPNLKVLPAGDASS